jgi:ubiquinone/menaquinone biosynthesis C-methylase UbiE
MIDFKNLWNKSAKEYQKYAFSHSQYKKTNKKLIKLANIKNNSIIVDLACGTGITTQEILIKNPNIQKIYAVDFSSEMLDRAKNSIQSEKVIFINSDAENIEKVI